MVRFHLESGARRSGTLGLRCRDLDLDRSTVRLREKGDSDREQPVSPSLVALLDRHAHDRRVTGPEEPVLRVAAGSPMSARRYDTIFGRARSCLGWAARTPVSADGRATCGRLTTWRTGGLVATTRW